MRSALRDEGVSHHYLPPGKWCRPSPGLTARLADSLGGDVLIGPTWTTDAPYRETAEEVRRCRADGVLTVDLEAASVFAVAEVRGYAAAAAFVVSDLLTEAGWAEHVQAPDLRPNLRRLVAAVRRAVSGGRPDVDE